MYKATLRMLTGLLLLGLARTPQAQVTLGGVVVPKEKIFVFIFIGHSNMVGFGNQEDSLLHARAWNYQIADSIGNAVPHHWELARDPIHSDGNFGDLRHSGCGMPFLKRLVADYPDVYFGLAANPKVSVSVKGKPGAEYCKGSPLYAEIISVVNEIKNNVTLAGIVSQFGIVEALFPDTSVVVRNMAAELRQLALDLRSDLGMPDLPFLIGEYPMDMPAINGFPSSAQIHDQVSALPTVLPRSAVIRHAGMGIPYIKDGIHYDTPGLKIWSNEAVDIFQDSLWLPDPYMVTTPSISSNARHGTFTDSLFVSLSTNTSGASIYYTLNNADPTQSSTRYTAPIVLRQSDTVKVRAYKTGLLQSEIVAASFIKINVLPPPWQHEDIGGTAINGDASSTNGKAFTIQASGSDIAGIVDAFHFVYQITNGDFSIVGRVKSLQNTHLQAKAGIMIRENLNDNSRSVLLAMTPTKGAVFVRREASPGTTVLKQDSSTTCVLPRFVRLVRAGNIFTAAHSANGTTWTTMGIDTIAMNSIVYAGLALASHENSRLCAAEIDSVKLSEGTIVSTGNAYTFLNPKRRDTYRIGDTISIEWTTLSTVAQEAVVEFSPNNGRYWEAISTTTIKPPDPFWQKFLWVVPDSIATFALSGKTARVMLRDYVKINIVVSDSFFITAPTNTRGKPGHLRQGITLSTSHDRIVVTLVRPAGAQEVCATFFSSSGTLVGRAWSAGHVLFSIPRNRMRSGVYFLRIGLPGEYHTGTIPVFVP